MGFQEKAQLEPDFAKAVWGLKPGKVLPQLVQSPVGFHIIKVTAHEPAGSMKVSEVRGAIQKALGVQQENLALTEWLAGKRAVTPIAFSKEFQNIVASAKPAVKTN
jgi:parvulin-like peptidyl-prolyl isomerase